MAIYAQVTENTHNARKHQVCKTKAILQKQTQKSIVLQTQWEPSNGENVWDFCIYTCLL